MDDLVGKEKDFISVFSNLEKEFCRLKENGNRLYKTIERLGNFDPRKEPEVDVSSNNAVALNKNSNFYTNLCSFSNELNKANCDFEYCLANLERMV
jgi:hypothetical protein